MPKVRRSQTRRAVEPDSTGGESLYSTDLMHSDELFHWRVDERSNLVGVQVDGLKNRADSLDREGPLILEGC
jgi:hypothetical protein